MWWNILSTCMEMIEVMQMRPKEHSNETKWFVHTMCFDRKVYNRIFARHFIKSYLDYAWRGTSIIRKPSSIERAKYRLLVFITIPIILHWGFLLLLFTFLCGYKQGMVFENAIAFDSLVCPSFIVQLLSTSRNVISRLIWIEDVCVAHIMRLSFNSMDS